MTNKGLFKADIFSSKVVHWLASQLWIFYNENNSYGHQFSELCSFSGHLLRCFVDWKQNVSLHYHTLLIDRREKLVSKQGLIPLQNAKRDHTLHLKEVATRNTPRIFWTCWQRILWRSSCAHLCLSITWRAQRSNVFTHRMQYEKRYQPIDRGICHSKRSIWNKCEEDFATFGWFYFAFCKG